MKSSRSLMTFVLCLVCGCLLLASCGKQVTETEVKLIPREVVFGNPEKAAPRLSPDGTKMAYLAPVDEVLNVWVGTIGEEDVQPVTSDTVRGIRRYYWSGDSKHILYLQDDGGNENWLLCQVDIETKVTTCLTPFEDVQVQIVDRNKNFPDELLIGVNKEDPRNHDVYRINLMTGEMKMVAKNPGDVVGWVSDADFKVRGCMKAGAAGGFDLMYRKTEKDDWKLLVSWDSQEALTSQPVGFTKDGKEMYLQDSRGVNTGRLVKMDIGSGDIEVIAEDPNYDIGSIIQNPDTYEIEAVTFSKDRQELVIIDEKVRPDFDAISKLDDGDVFLSSRDDADDTWLIGFDLDDGPISYYSFDRNTKKATFLFYHRPVLKEYQLAKMEPIQFTSRDGLTIHGYITFPPGHEEKNLPMVLMVHGGPWARDYWGYNPDAQWLANRGYICLQVNFRGSSGYGKDFINAGDKAWGGTMHNDLIDGVNWAVGQGYADPARIGIYGWSYGGYAALAGATFTPRVFTCAIDGCGPSNIITLMESIPPYWTALLDMFKARVGDPVADKEFLESRSPLFWVDSIRIPVMVVQGANDPRVKQAEADRIVEAMKEKGLDQEYLLFPDEGHGLARPENRIKFYAAAEKFLAKHLGGRYEEETVPAQTQP